ncbi:hypothetical protein [Faecalibacter bovis]|uniref:DUF11 domain-containing protein n=1 Tax=Faecalibacter bovis TaxID=2898187 RepID=A0ABX7XDJ6_9FLAO|nr:hypothetical protein [Faecalibacter bovis]QTV05925.1 hypothetical protein J9309_00825 [Faecalibacter bovis]
MYRFLFLLLPFMLFAQIGVNTENPHPESDLHLGGLNKTMIVNHLTDLNAITDPQLGMIAYDSTSGCVRGYQQDGWSTCFSNNVSNLSFGLKGIGFKGTYTSGTTLTNATFEVTLTNNSSKPAILGFGVEDLQPNLEDVNVTAVYQSGSSTTNTSTIDVNFPSKGSKTIVYRLTGELKPPHTTLVGIWKKITLSYNDTQEITTN